MTSNYLVNNAVTYRDRRRRGWRLLSGWLRYASICAIGLAAMWRWPRCCTLTACRGCSRASPGAGCGAVWNYVSTFLAG